MLLFPVVVGLVTRIGLTLIHIPAVVRIKPNVAGQVAQIVHNTINTEVVTVDLVVRVLNKTLLVQRHLSHTVDGILCSIAHVGYTVLGTL